MSACGTTGGAMRHWRNDEKACDLCVAARRRVTKGAALDRLRGIPRMTTLGTDAHALIATIPRDQLARATGLTVHKLCHLAASGPEGAVHRTTRDRILAAGSIQYWTPVGIQRRLRALHAIGWSMRALADALNYPHATLLLRLLNREALCFVRRDMAERVLAAYDAHSMTPGVGRGATRAVNRSAREGWAPPLAWTNIDDPSELPDLGGGDDEIDPVVVDRLLHLERVTSTNAEKCEAMRRWLASGKSEASLCVAHGWKDGRYVERQDGAA